MLVAVAIGVFESCAVGSTFWVWWRSGRDFSFDPLEIANAFDAPLLGDAVSNVAFESIKQHKIRYGVAKRTEQPFGLRDPRSHSGVNAYW